MCSNCKGIYIYQHKDKKGKSKDKIRFPTKVGCSCKIDKNISSKQQITAEPVLPGLPECIFKIKKLKRFRIVIYRIVL